MAAKAKAKTKKAKAKEKEVEPVAITERRYFERGDRFWEVWLEGTDGVRTRTGKIGSPGQLGVKDFDAYYDATRELRRLVVQKTKDGFEQRVAGAKPGIVKRDAKLEEAIAANPYDVDAYLVYGDWLQGEGDPRGELIALQAGGKQAEAKKLLAKHADTLLGTLQQHRRCYDHFHDKRIDAFTWKNGFIFAARLAHNQYASDWKGRLAPDVLEPLLSHPSGRFLVELTFNENDDPTEDTLDDLVAVLARRAPPTLRKIRIGDDVSQISWYRVGNLGPLWQGVPNLTHFQIEAGEFTLGTIELPNLTHAVFHTGGLAKASAKSIARAQWPKLEHLEVYFGDPTYGGSATVADIMPLLDRTDLPNLKYLAIKNAVFQADLIEAAAKSRLVKQLHTLDVSGGILIDDNIDALLKYKDALRHLEVLDISGSYLSKPAVKKLAGFAKKIVADDLREDDSRYRYVWVRE